MFFVVTERHQIRARYFILGALLLIFMITATAHAQDRHALVIGNSDYGSRFGLINPKSDSEAIAAKLLDIGYSVHRGGAVQNLGLEEFNTQIESFLESVEDGDSTLIYYAGHGSASGGVNYLIPILPAGVKLRSESDIRDRSISLESILERVDRRNPNGVNVLFFDACRDAPVENSTRTINLTGMVDLDPRTQPRGSFVGFSTEYGMLALDDDEDDTGNSPFASALLNSLQFNAAAPIELFYKSVVEDVYDRTDGQQFPIQESKLRGNYCIIECEDSSITNQIVEKYGTLSVVTEPAVAEVCVFVDGWEAWDCGSNKVLPLDVPIQVRVTAKKYNLYTTTTILRGRKHVLNASLEPKNYLGLKIAGTVVGILAAGVLLSGGSSSSSSNSSDSNMINSDGGDDSEPTTITVVRP